MDIILIIKIVAFLISVILCITILHLVIKRQIRVFLYAKSILSLYEFQRKHQWHLITEIPLNDNLIDVLTDKGNDIYQLTYKGGDTIDIDGETHKIIVWRYSFCKEESESL